MRGVLCDSKYEELLVQFAKTSKLSIGLIIGQIGKSGKDLVIHLAKTQHSEHKIEGEEEQINDDKFTKVSDIKNSIVAEHALNAIRMIVGGFNILGVFVVSENNLMTDNSALQKIKTILMDIKSTLNSNGILYASTDQFDNGDKIFLNYVASHKNYICKTISTDPLKAANVSPVDWKFVAKSMDFFEFETTYEIATTFPLRQSNNQFDTEKYVMGTIDKIAANLAKSIMFYNGEPCEAELTVEKFIKNFANGESSKVKVTIYSDAAPLATSDNGVLTPHESLICYTGIITSRVYAAPRNTIAEVEGFIHNDIIRSITTRLQIYYDAFLANDDGGNDYEEEKDREVNSTCPPRRVFFPIGNSSITFSDYLFQNENEETTVKQSMEILGVELNLEDVDSNAEVAMQYTISEKADLDSENAINGGACEEVTRLVSKDSGKFIIILGIVGIVVALIASVILHFLMK